MSSKYIHYCWFGGKPLPKLAKKCIKSWKKYLPDYEIIEWNESNVDLEECPFIKEAYENKKWAFVADYARTKAIYEMGGIYFDTDMKIIKNIDKLLETDGGFLGVEDSHLIACGVWYESKKHSYLSKKMLEFYQSQDFFDINNMYAISIPRILSSILTDYDVTKNETQVLKHNETIYRRDYFYPYSYDFQNNVFTDDTCMIHYYDASWVPKWEQRENKIFRIFGKEKGKKVIRLCKIVNRVIRKLAKLFLYPLIVYKRRTSVITKEYLESIESTIQQINANTNKENLAFVNPNWMGVRNATNELFDNVVYCTEVYRKKDVKLISKAIVDANIKLVVFSGFCIGWKDLCEELHKAGVIVKTYFHGSHSQVLEPYGWERNMEIFKLHKAGVINQMATCKESLVNFYKKQGCDIVLLGNRVGKNVSKAKKKETKRIGIYAAKTDDFRKNVFAQISAVSLLDDDYTIDMVPLTDSAIAYCNLLGVTVDGLKKSVNRDELMERMSTNDLNLYVTFSECAPMLPLESMSQGVICLTGNNHHYFMNHELEKYLVVNNESSSIEIATKIKLCLENREKILKLSAEWYKENTKFSKKSVKDFLNMKEANNEK
ncbi:MAG: hypothetical protein E7160_03905 [Firmicutes bacterium]|nr:hypothetical protein [Bacillota bacterium]